MIKLGLLLSMSGPSWAMFCGCHCC